MLCPARLSGVLGIKIFSTEGRIDKMTGCKGGCKVQGGLWELSGLAEPVTFLLFGEIGTQLTFSRPGSRDLTYKWYHTYSQKLKPTLCALSPCYEQSVFCNHCRKTENL